MNASCRVSEVKAPPGPDDVVAQADTLKTQWRNSGGDDPIFVNLLWKGMIHEARQPKSGRNVIEKSCLGPRILFIVGKESL